MPRTSTGHRKGALTALCAVGLTLLGVAAVPSVAQAAGSVTINASADSFGSAAQPTTVNGARAYAITDDAPIVSWVKFNVTGIPTGAPVTSATLTLTGTSDVQTTQTVTVNSLPNTWDESTTYSTRPTPGAVVGTGSMGTNLVMNVTVPISGNGTSSFAITRAAAGGNNIWTTRENTNTAKRPKLVVNYGDVPTTPTNTAPTVSAGPDRAVTLPGAASLDGTVSDDGLPSGSSVTQTWSKVSGPGTVTFANGSAVDTTANFSAAGTYVLRLTASDGTLSASDDVTVTVASAPVQNAALPYGPDSFFQSKVTNAPIDAALTSSFQSFMAQHEEQGGNGVYWPKVNLNPGWSGHNYVHRAGGTAPVWKLTGTATGISNTRLSILKTQGVHMADDTWSTVPTGDQDRLLVVQDFELGYTMQCADVVPNSSTRTFTASNCGIMWHSSNGLDYRNSKSDDSRNFTSRGRINDAMQVPREELDAAKAAGTGLGRVMHLFFVGTCGADGFVHPMVGAENKPCWTGPVAGADNDGGWGAEGTRLRIKPSVDLVGRGLTGEALVIARTLQENGTYIGDNAGGATQLKIGPPEDYVGTNLATDVFKGKLDWRNDFEVVQPAWQG